jgi:hypothetical protein
VFGRKKLPAALTPALDRDERILAWAESGSAAVVATNRGLWLPDMPRMAWHEVHKATWNDGTLTVIGSSAEQLDGFALVSDVAPVSVTLDDPGTLPRRVRERVTASVSLSTLHQLPGGGAARVIGRRVSGQDGLTWSVRLERVQDEKDPAVRALIADLVTSAKSAIASE